MGYRDDLAAAQSRLEQLERQLADERVSPAELDAARFRQRMLSGQNTTLKRLQTRLSYLTMYRLALGLLVLCMGSFDLVASYGTADGLPPLGHGSGWLAVLGALLSLVIIGLRPPHRLVGIGGLVVVGVVLLSKAFVDELRGLERELADPTSLFPFVLPGALAIFFAVVLLLLTRQRG